MTQTWCEDIDLWQIILIEMDGPTIRKIATKRGPRNVLARNEKLSEIFDQRSDEY